jgi:hypothetical protein
MLQTMNYQFGGGGRDTFAEYLNRRLEQPHFANARSVRNALDRARLRQASRLFADRDRAFTRADLCTIESDDIRASRLFNASGSPAARVPGVPS